MKIDAQGPQRCHQRAVSFPCSIIRISVPYTKLVANIFLPLLYSPLGCNLVQNFTECILCFSCSFESNTVIFWKFLYNTVQQSPDIPPTLYAVGALKTLNVWPKYKVNKTLFKIEIGRRVQCEKTKNSIFELSCHPILMKIGTRLLSVWIKLKQSENENMNL